MEDQYLAEAEGSGDKETQKPANCIEKLADFGNLNDALQYVSKVKFVILNMDLLYHNCASIIFYFLFLDVWHSTK